MGQFWEKIEPPAVEQDANAVILELPEAPSGRFDRLDPAVEPLCCGVANAVVEVSGKRCPTPLTKTEGSGQDGGRANANSGESGVSCQTCLP